MKAMLLRQTRPAEQSPLECSDLPSPKAAANEILVRVSVCGVCRTDLHIIEGDINATLPIIPGHQIVGTVQQAGNAVQNFHNGDRVGIPWLHSTCGQCEFCSIGRENLCLNAQFTGFHVPGGYAETVVADASFAVHLPTGYEDAQIAPLLCAGIIGLRALRLTGVQPKQRVGMYGFGGSAHIALQIARHWGCEAWVATRGKEHQRLARELGAAWVGRAEEVPDSSLQAAVLFAPAGQLVPQILRALRRNGTLTLAGIYLSPIPELSYDLLYHERAIRSVANATREDAAEMMKLAAEFPIRTEVETFPLTEANTALQELKQSAIRGAAVLRVAQA